MTQPVRHDLDAIRARVSIVSLVGRRVKLRRSGRDFAGLCPFHHEKSGSFTVSDEKGFGHCFGCGWHGDIFRFLEDSEGISFRDAVERLAEKGDASIAAGSAGTAPAELERERSKAPSLFVPSSEVGRYLWRSATPARGEIVEAWLKSRGLDPHAIPGALDALRYHPRAPVVPWKVMEDPERAGLTAPAMIAGIRDGDGHVRGVHATYLTPSGTHKAMLPRRQDGGERPTRMIWGRVMRNGVFLTPFEPGAGAAEDAREALPLFVGEGIETVWAFVQARALDGEAMRVAAALSLNNLQGGYLEGSGGCLQWWNIRADPEKPPFTVPHRGPATVVVDADMKPIERKVQMRRGERWTKRQLGPLERAELCAALGVQAWRRAGARPVMAARPPVGMDFNDAIRRVA